MSQIDRLSLEGYTNLDSWVRMVDDKVVAVLLQRLRSIIDLWGTQITQTPDEIATAYKVRSTSLFVLLSTVFTMLWCSQDRKQPELRIEPIQHELCIQNQFIYLDPPLEQAKVHWYSQLEDWMGMSLIPS